MSEADVSKLIFSPNISRVPAQKPTVPPVHEIFGLVQQMKSHSDRLGFHCSRQRPDETECSVQIRAAEQIQMIQNVIELVQQDSLLVASR